MASDMQTKLMEFIPRKKSLTLVLLASCGLVVTLKATWSLLGKLKERRDRNQKLKKIQGPKAHWFFGNLKDAPKGQAYNMFKQRYRDFGPVWKVQLGPTICEVVLASPEYIQRVMSTGEPKDRLYSLLNPWIGDGLLLSYGKKWFRNRRLLTPSFHFDILKPYQKLFSESAMVLVQKWKDILEAAPGESIEMFDHVSLFTLDSLMKCIFSNESNFQKDGKKNPYINAVYEIGDLLLDRVRYPPFHSDVIFYFSPTGYRLRKAMKVSHDFTKSVIKAKREEKMDATKTTKDRQKKYMDFLDMLLDCRDEEGNGLTDKEIQDEVDTFMFEGHDTTASGISWCLYNLAIHPNYQEKCRQEIMAVLQDRDEVAWSDLAKLNFLSMCVKESLRTHPPVPRVGRRLTKEVELPDGRVIPRDTMVGLNIYACHHNPAIWQDPEVFDPERFSLENSTNRHSYAHIPFSAGPRNCIGQNFAMNELKTTVALVVKHFRLRVDEKKDIKAAFSLTLKAKDGVWLKLEPLV